MSRPFFIFSVGLREGRALDVRAVQLDVDVVAAASRQRVRHMVRACSALRDTVSEHNHNQHAQSTHAPSPASCSSAVGLPVPSMVTAKLSASPPTGLTELSRVRVSTMNE